MNCEHKYKELLRKRIIREMGKLVNPINDLWGVVPYKRIFSFVFKKYLFRKMAILLNVKLPFLIMACKRIF